MTQKEQIDYIKNHHRAKKTFDDYTNYFIFIFPLAFIGIGLSMLFNFLKFHTGLPILLVGLFLVALGTVFSIFTAKRLTENLTFEQIYLYRNTDLDEIANKLKTYFKANNIHIDRRNNVITIMTKLSAFSWGETMTIIKLEDNIILINSRPNNGSSQPVTIIKDRRNIKKLKQILNISSAQQ